MKSFCLEVIIPINKTLIQICVGKLDTLIYGNVKNKVLLSSHDTTLSTSH